MKKVISLIMAAALSLSAAACGQNSDSSVADKSSSKADEKPAVESCKIADDKFDTYVSNTYVATGNNFVVKKANEVTYRAYFPLEEYGELEYAFYFSNTVDSTYKADGKQAFAGKEGGEYEISSAYVCDGGTGPDDEITSRTEVTFDGAGSKKVAPAETFWSDPVTLNIPEDHYLVWEWTVTGKDIPCNKMSNLTSTTSSKNGSDFTYCDDVPLPLLIGAKRDVKYRVTAIGDSITQGCMTDFMAYEFWAARIAKELGSDYAFWNCGLGWARASDCSQKGNWLGRALNSDIMIVAFGTNDIVSGEYGGDGGNNADEVNGYISTILEQSQAAGCKTILFNAPPQDYDEEHEAVRTALNDTEKQTAEKYGAEYFDFAAQLSTPENPACALYGGHPNGEGGEAVCKAFMKQFAELLGK